VSLSEMQKSLQGIAGTLVWLEETDSTNRVLREMALGGAEHLTVVATDHQVAGRGRLDRSWFSQPGAAIQCSTLLVFGDEHEQRRVGLSNVAAAVALAETLTEAGLEVAIKWPNDVLVSQKKVSGILSELIDLPRGSAVVLGIGINVNNASFPPEIASTATSLAIEGGRAWDRWELLRSFIARLSGLIDAADLIVRYRALCSTIGKQVRVDTGGVTFNATATGLDSWGGLVLADGQVLHVGDITHLHQA